MVKLRLSRWFDANIKVIVGPLKPRFQVFPENCSAQRSSGDLSVERYAPDIGAFAVQWPPQILCDPMNYLLFLVLDSSLYHSYKTVKISPLLISS